MHKASSTAKVRYPRRSEVNRALATLRENGFNPSSFEFRPDGSFRLSIAPDGGSTLTDFDLWNQAGKL